LVETSFDGIIIHQNGLIVFANITAATADEIMGRPILSFVHPEFCPVVLRRMVSATRETQPVLREKFLRSDGSIINVDVVAIPFAGTNKPAVNVVFRNIAQQ
jgi:PAS domain S-box-containing protein